MFFLIYLFIIISFIAKFKWPTNIICAKRSVKSNPEDSLEINRKPTLNKNNIILEEHFQRILKISKSLKNIRLKSSYSHIDPLISESLTILFLFLFIGY